MLEFSKGFLNWLIGYSNFITDTIIAIFAFFQGGLYFADKKESKYTNKAQFSEDYPLYNRLLKHADFIFKVIIVLFIIGLVLQYMNLNKEFYIKIQNINNSTKN